MVPILSGRTETGRFRKTLADSLLPRYDEDLYVAMKDDDGNVRKVPAWRFIERYVRITDKRGAFTVFELKKAQIELYRELCEQRRAGKPMRIDILKARQLGMSTFIAALYVTLYLLSPNQTAVIVADKAEHATTLFKKYKFMYYNLPKWLREKLPLLSSNAREVAVDYGDGQRSSIKIVVADEDAGRGDTCQGLHLSEVAAWKDIGATLASLLQTVDNTNPNSIIVFETTAKGVNEYKYVYDMDAAGETAYKALFFPWHDDPGYRQPYTGFELLDHERKLVDELHLDMEQIAWYRGQYENLRKDVDTLRQEFPSTPIEAFVSTGSSVFPMELVQKRKSELLGHEFPRYEFQWDRKTVSEQGDVITLHGKRPVQKQNGLITVFKEPMKGHPYIVSVDPSQGGEDWFVAQCFDNASHEQVAVMRIRRNTNFQWIAEQVYCLADWYNGALLNAETNNSTGTYVLEVASQCGHRFIYQDNSIDTLTDRYENRYGYKVSSRNREALINLTVAAFRDHYQMINDWMTLCEMEDFQVIELASGQEKMMATPGKHDDHITSLFGIFLARRSNLQTTLIAESGEGEKRKIDPLDYVRPRRTERKEGFILWD